MTRLVAFDLDGTLIDTPAGIVETFTAAFGSMGVEPPAPAAIRATIGHPLPQAFGMLLGVPAADARVSVGVSRYRVLFDELVLPRAASLLFPGVAEGLSVLRDSGFALAVATSRFHAGADALLAAAGIRDRFDLVAGADQVARPKPDPEMGRLVLRELGMPAARAVMVGDTTHDVLMAAAAGMRSIAVTYGVHGAELLTSVKPTWIAGTFGDVVQRVLAYARA